MPTIHHKFAHRYAPNRNGLYVVSTLFNPQRYKSRYRLYEEFQKHMSASGATLVTAELALGDRPFELKDPGPYDLQLRTKDEMWLKENLINLAVQRLPPDWRFVAWLDGDIEFLRADWCDEICHLLQHYKVIQVFRNAIDVGPHGESLATHTSLLSSYQKGEPLRQSSKYGGYNLHPGFGWAATREAFEELGGLIDTSILGAADHAMAWALVGGDVMATSPQQMSTGYRNDLLAWQDRCQEHIRGDVGFMDGTILHHWHGRKTDRRYQDRWKILIKWKYDPRTDLKRDAQGLWGFTRFGARMRNDIRAYFSGRNEDSIDL